MSPVEPIPGGCRSPSRRRKSAWNWSRIPASGCFQVDELLQRSIGLALLILQDFMADFSEIPRSGCLEAKFQGVLNAEFHAGSNADFPVETARAAFPALTRPPGFIFFDNAAGAQ